MNTKTIMKFSPIYLSLFSFGVLSSSYSFATDCINNQPIKINNQKNAVINECNLKYEITNSINPDVGINEEPINVSNSDLTIKNSVFYTEFKEGTNTNSILSAVDSNITLQNTDFNIELGNRDLNTIRIKNSNLNANNIKINIISDAPDYSLTTIILENSTATINGGVFTNESNDLDEFISSENATTTINNLSINQSSKEGIVYSFTNLNNKLTINNSQLTTNGDMFGQWFSDDDKNGELSLNINNSQLSAPSFITFGKNEQNPNTLTGYTKINITAQNSQLSGGISIDNLHPENNISLNLNNSTFVIPKVIGTDEMGKTEIVENNVTHLALNKSNITLSNVNGLQTFTILNNLSGNGNFTLNTNLADQQSDKIVVQGKDEGSFGLIIKDSGKAPKSANGKVTLVETKSGQAQFRLLNKDYVDAGAYRYRLRKEGANWVLSNHQSEPASNTPTTNNVDQGNTASTTPTQPVSPTPVVPTTPSNNNEAYIATLSGRANALVSLRQAAVIQVEDDLAGIHQRLGELKTGAKNAVWVRNVNSRKKLDGLQTSANSYASGFEQNLHNLQLGVDTSLSDNIRVGGFVGVAHSHVDFNGEYGSGKINSKSVGLYGTYQADNGLYIDNILKYSRLHSQSDATEKRHYNAYTLSSEIGKIFNLADQWTITPQAQLAWTKLSGQADEKAISSMYSRVGLRVAKGIAFNHWALQPYAEFNAITTRHNAAKIRVDTDDLDVAESRGRFESAIGIKAGVGSHRFGIQVSRTNGKHLDKPFAIQAVYRYQW